MDSKVGLFGPKFRAYYARGEVIATGPYAPAACPEMPMPSLPLLDQHSTAPSLMESSGKSVSATAVQLCMSLLQVDSKTARELCLRCGIDPAALTDPEHRVQRHALQRLIECAEAVSGDASLWLDAGTRVWPGVFESVGYAMMGSQGMLDALTRLAKFAPILDDQLAISLQPEAGNWRLIIDAAWNPQPAAVLDGGLSALLGFARFLSGGQSVRLLEIETPEAEPAHAAKREQVFGCSVIRYKAPRLSVLLDGADLLRPFPSSPQVLDRFHNELAHLRLDELGTQLLASRSVRHVLVRHLPGGVPKLNEVANEIGMKPRVLQRALEREGTSFRALIDDTRRQLAHLYLRHTPKPV